MKYIILFFLLINVSAYAQKTTRQTVSAPRGVSITRSITDADTLFLMMGQNAKYTRITDIVILKHGTPNDINDLLTECIKFMVEADGNSLEYQGNTIVATGGQKVMLFGSDDPGYVMLNKNAILTMQTDLKQYLK